MLWSVCVLESVGVCVFFRGCGCFRVCVVSRMCVGFRERLCVCLERERECVSCVFGSECVCVFREI